MKGAEPVIYADNAATTALDRDAFAAMTPYLLDQYGNASQPYSFAKPAKKAIAAARETIARCIGARPGEIIFTSGGTESDNWVIKGVPHGEKGAILTSQIEHHAILHACAAVERQGVPVGYLPVDGRGVVAPETLAAAMTEATGLVSVMLVNNEIGTIEPIRELADIAHRRGALFHTDAVQAIGHIPVNVEDLKVDLLSASAHKFHGPKGIGFLYVRTGIAMAPFIDGGAQEFGLRAGTENVASIVGMAAALRKSCLEMEETDRRLRAMERTFLEVLDKAGIDYLRNGAENRVPGNISISIKNASGEMLLHRLDLKGICVSTGSACDSVNTQVSHVIQALKVPADYAEGTIRISFGRDNQERDAEDIARAIVSILRP